MINTLQPWYWRSLPLHRRSGSDVFDALFRSATAANPGAIATLLESPCPATQAERINEARYSICAGAPRQVDGQPQLWTPPLGTIVPWLRSRLQDLSPCAESAPPLPFTGGWLGWLGYDLAWEIEQLPSLNPDPLPFPVACWYVPETFAVLDHWEQVVWLAASDPNQLDLLEQQLTKACKAERHPLNTLEPNTDPFPAAEWSAKLHFATSQRQYEAAVRRAKDYIQAGDIFQTNLSVRFGVHTHASSWSIYQALQQINPSPFASYWQTPWGAIASCSPERLVHLQDQVAQTRPIAGTRSRGATPAADRQLEQELLANTKENAEHIMLVDLERNDLGRVCRWGSVQVNELLTIERYSHVMHLVSNIHGYLHPEQTAIDLICAMFPGGTITGCPKVRCMEIIEELEPIRRNLFYGSCGYLDWRGQLDLNILIRTLLCTSASPDHLDQTVWGQVGAGIVADSDPSNEWQESLQKAKAQLLAIRLAEHSN
ncbi:anthranilate synthase component I [Oculatella sp. LEGE 06141]|uniref:anthranilate synthase component I n=1 Tax=Oculatella sp. LEGE 06141 TaxID=1828648 RepID=UPI0018807B9A|nr:anthranilate synthase component I [Oculatella sp. LEGE 06141]MBE9181806.1 anthranilate synthase component I [Oculatella sp. LEGE 06141]